jgi:hypothetical protein
MIAIIIGKYKIQHIVGTEQNDVMYTQDFPQGLSINNNNVLVV